MVSEGGSSRENKRMMQPPLRQRRMQIFFEDSSQAYFLKIILESKPTNSIITTSKRNVSHNIEVMSAESILKNLDVANTS